MKFPKIIGVNSRRQLLSGRRLSRETSQRGAALIITLLLLLLLAGLSLVMFMTVFSGSMINGYYRNYRGSFYAADSGANIVRETMINKLLATAPVTYTPGTQPITATAPGIVLGQVQGTYNVETPVTSGGAANSWAESFHIVQQAAQGNLPASPSLSLAPGYPVPSNPIAGGVCVPGGNTSGCQNWKYVYNYNIIVSGQSQGNEQAKVLDSGQITINTQEQPNGPTPTSFAAWGAFINNYGACSGFLVPGLFSGPSFTNGTWNFGPPSYGSYIFTGQVGQATANADFWFNSGGWNCIAGSGGQGSMTNAGQTISPNYQAGWQPNMGTLPLPVNSYNQESAVLNGQGANCSSPPCTATAPTQAQMGAVLKNVTGTAYPPTGSIPASGVYLPYGTTASACNGVTPPCFLGGGIYVQGTAGIQLAATTDTGGNPTETYTITQGATVTKVVVDDTTGTTSISSGASQQMINGVPTQYDPTTGQPMGPATMLYASSSISSLDTGLPGANPAPTAAVANGTALTISTPGNVNITGNVEYATEPVTTYQNQIPGTPADTLIPGSNTGQVLGIFTVNGNINLDQSVNNGNIQVDGSLAAISQSGTGGFFNTGACINTFNNVGGQIQSDIYGACMNTENTYFDQRFASGFAPPWFPETTIQAQGNGPATYTASPFRVQWIDLSHM